MQKVHNVQYSSSVDSTAIIILSKWVNASVPTRIILRLLNYQRAILKLK